MAATTRAAPWPVDQSPGDPGHRGAAVRIIEQRQRRVHGVVRTGRQGGASVVESSSDRLLVLGDGEEDRRHADSAQLVRGDPGRGDGDVR
ncbi:MAG: hypothetical protein V9G12_03520 [Microthrixaceae bacterium]